MDLEKMKTRADDSPEDASCSYQLGEYTLEPRRRALHRAGAEVQLGARSFGVLEVLVAHAGQVVTKEDLIEAVWGGIAVGDDSLARAVSDLRTALGDDAAHPRYIRTVHRQGYVLVAPVTPLGDGARSPAPEEGKESRWSRVSVGLALAAVVLAASMAWLLWLAPADGGSVQQAVPDFAAWKLRALGPSPFAAAAIKPAFARTHDLLAVVVPDPDTGMHSIFLLRPDGGEPLQLTRGIEVRGPSPEFAPDDSHILFTSYHADPEMGMVPDVWSVPVPAGEPTLLMPRASAASYSPGGEDLVYAAVTSTGTSIRVRRADGGDLQVADRGFWPRWSPDGAWIAYTTSDPDGGDGTLHVVRPDGTGHRALTSIPAQMYGLCWASGGGRVIFASYRGGPSALWSADVDSGAVSPVTHGPGDSSSPTMSHDGRRLVFAFDQRRWHVYLAADPAEGIGRILAQPGIMAAAVAPGGDRVALAVGADAQSPAIVVFEVETRERRTISGMAAESLTWTPDGRDLLVAAASPDGQYRWIWRLPVDGGVPEPLLKGQTIWNHPSASPDGTMLAAVRRSETGSELVVRELLREADRTLAESSSITALRWSPDGRYVAWSGALRPNDLTSGGVWVCAVPGGSRRRLTADGAWPGWEADGEHLVFLRFLENEGIWRVPIAGGTPRPIRRLEGEMARLSLEALDTGPRGAHLLLLLSGFEGELYALEAPDGPS